MSNNDSCNMTLNKIMFGKLKTIKIKNTCCRFYLFAIRK